jgi:hypothetical protein
MRKVNRIAAALVVAGILSGGLMVGQPVYADSGLSASNSFLCAFAQGVLYKIPDKAGRAVVLSTLQSLVDAILGAGQCSLV